MTAAFGRFWPSAWAFPPTAHRRRPSPIAPLCANVEDALRLLPQKLHWQHASGGGGGEVGVAPPCFVCILRIESSVRHTFQFPHPLPTQRGINIAKELSSKWILRYFCSFRFTKPKKTEQKKRDTPHSFK